MKNVDFYVKYTITEIPDYIEFKEIKKAIEQEFTNNPHQEKRIDVLDDNGNLKFYCWADPIKDVSVELKKK